MSLINSVYSELLYVCFKSTHMTIHFIFIVILKETEAEEQEVGKK